MIKIKTTHNKNKVIFKIFIYLKDRENEEKTYYKCEYFKKFKCRGRIHVVEENVTRELGEHNHPADRSKHLADELLNVIKDKAVHTKESPRDIILEASAHASLPICTKLPTVQLMKKTILRKRKSERVFAPPANINFDIPTELQLTKGNENFILFDSGASSTRRMIIFGTATNLYHLETNKHWYVDGTFDSAPSLFKQVVTIHIIVGGYVLPMIYALLADKKESTYVEVLEQLHKINSKLNPLTVMIDFEKGKYYYLAF